MPSVMDQLKKLNEQREQLLEGAKKEALDAIHAAIETLRELGFHYRVVEGEGTSVGNFTPSRKTGSRRTGIRQDVLKAVKGAKDGVSRSTLLEAMGAKGDKSAEQSISNALAALKKAGSLTADDGVYKAA